MNHALFAIAGILGVLFCIRMITVQRGENCAIWIGLAGAFGGVFGWALGRLLVMAVQP